MYPQSQIANNPNALNFLLQQRLRQQQEQQAAAQQPPVLPDSGMWQQRPAPVQQETPRGILGQSAEYQEPQAQLPQPTPNRMPAMIEQSVGRQLPAQAPVSLADVRPGQQGAATPQASDLPPQMATIQAPPALPSPYTPMPQYERSHQHGEKMGFGQRIMHALKSGGLGFLRGGVGGAAAGLVGGAVDPEFWHRAQYQYQTLPLWQQRFAGESAYADQVRQDTTAQTQLENQKNIAGDRAERLRLQADAQRNLEAERLQNNREQEAQAREKRAAAEYKQREDLATQRLNLSKEDAEYVGNPWNMVNTQKYQNRGNVIPALDGKGVYRLPNQEQVQKKKLEIEREKGLSQLDLDILKDNIKRPRELADYRTKKEIDSQYKDPKEEPRYKEAKLAHARIQALINRAAKQDEEAKGITDAAKNDAKRASAQGDWDSARRELEVARQMYPEYIEGGEGDGGYPFVSFKEDAPRYRERGKGNSDTGASPKGRTARTLAKATYDEMVKDAAAGDKDAIEALKDVQSGKWTVK